MGEARLAKGGVIAGKWVLERRLGRGGMGEVWLATHHTLHQQVAIKILDRDAFPLEVAEEARSRFDLEARIAAKLARKTRHIVTVVDNGRDEEIDYLVMELLEGQSLEDRLVTGPLPILLVADVIRQAARGLMVAHAEGVIHRDLKPGNLYLTTDDNGERLLKLLDFGIAKARVRADRDGPPSSHATRAGVIIGTAQYMSPEQARGLEIDARVDVWALAAVAYELLTTYTAFEGESDVDLLMKICMTTPLPARSHRPDLPVAVDGVFERAFARSIDERFQDARSFADALQAALDPASAVVPSRAPESVITYVATPPPMAPVEVHKRRYGLFIGLGALVVVLAAGISFSLHKTAPAPPPSAAAPKAEPTQPPTPPAYAPTQEPAAPPTSASASTSAAPGPSSKQLAPAPKATAKPKSTDKSEIL